MRSFKLIRQSGTNYSDLTVISQVAMLRDIEVRHCALENLSLHQELLLDTSDLWVPVGSVEFVRQAMKLAGITEPANITYPEPLLSFFGRQVKSGLLSEIKQKCFVKPKTTKLFTGFVFDPDATPDQYNQHDREQLDVLVTKNSQCDLWISELSTWVAEFRFYIVEGRIVGFGRYDDGEDDDVEPDIGVVNQMVRVWRESGVMPVACSIDVGVSSLGHTTLVECNDAWALGYYKGSLKPSDYVEMLARRWKQIKLEN